MIYLSSRPGAADATTGTRSRGKALAAPLVADVGALLRRHDAGVMLTPTHGACVGDARRANWWAADSGRFARPAAYTEAGYLAWLGTLVPVRATCLFATAPDVVGDWVATWALSRPVLPRIRAMGFPAAVVAQDGMTALPPAAEWDVLFMGGTTAFKLSEAAYRLAREAQALGKWTHMGRVNSWRRLRAAHQAGYRSADGTCLAFNPPQYTREIAGWLDRLTQQPPLALWP